MFRAHWPGFGLLLLGGLQLTAAIVEHILDVVNYASRSVAGCRVRRAVIASSSALVDVAVTATPSQSRDSNQSTDRAVVGPPFSPIADMLDLVFGLLGIIGQLADEGAVFRLQAVAGQDPTEQGVISAIIFEISFCSGRTRCFPDVRAVHWIS